MSKHKIMRTFLCGLLVFLMGGCGDAQDEGSEVTQNVPIQEAIGNDRMENNQTDTVLNEAPLDISKAREIPFLTEGEEVFDLLQVDFIEVKGNVDAEQGTYTEISECTRNETAVFYVKSYGEDGAQYHYLNQVYCYDSAKGEGVLLYETSEAAWLNEFLANDRYLYWVEYVYSDEKVAFDYNVMQYNLNTEEVTCIASRNAAQKEEICLSVSNEYVTWYDGYFNGSADIAIYNVKKQEVCILQDSNIRKFMPYERLAIVDDGITYFSQNAEGEIYINRYNIKTQETYCLLLGEKDDFNKLASCFSSERYIGWLTEYSQGVLYIYDMNNGTLYSVTQSDDMRVFSAWLSDCLYINESFSECVYVYDFEMQEIYCQDIEQGTALSLRPYGENHLYMKVVDRENVRLLTMHLTKDVGELK